MAPSGKRRALTPREQRRALKAASKEATGSSIVVEDRRGPSRRDQRRTRAVTPVVSEPQTVAFQAPQLEPEPTFESKPIDGVPAWEFLYEHDQAPVETPVEQNDRRKPPKRRLRRVVDVVAILLFLVGLSSVSWFGWQYTGTNIVANHQQSVVKEELDRQWSEGKEFKDAVALVRVSRFGKTWEKPVIRGVDTGALARGLGWNPKTAEPGQMGNFVIAGHRVTHGEPFKDFPALMVGDEVEVETRTHVYTYKLRNSGTSLRLPFTAGWVQKPVPSQDDSSDEPLKQVLTMYTCASLFHTDFRNVVFGDLVRDEVKPGTEPEPSKTPNDQTSAG